MRSNPLQGRVGMNSDRTRHLHPLHRDGKASLLLSGAGLTAIAVLLLRDTGKPGTAGGPNGGIYAPIPVPQVTSSCSTCAVCAA